MPSCRDISARIITETVRELFIKANIALGQDALALLAQAVKTETSERAGHVLELILENARIAREDRLPLCQDTGLAIVFVELGQQVHVTDGDFAEAVQEGVRQAYRDGCLRKSVCDPLDRHNTGDNTPAIIHTEIVPGRNIRIRVMPKGGGSENMSGVVMLTPAVGMDGIKQYVLDQVVKAGANPCPPTVIGVGIGGNLETAVILAKKALLRPLGKSNRRDERLAKLERDLLDEINRLGIGPQGYGGATTALAVHCEIAPCHIASLPVAVNIQCHAVRHGEAVI
ncbi:MAG: fumarate hydratase [Syntrophus sp. (in: bacteria)]|nr:fumarate hydratase [Syntrophus sp. (in: bacteria)]